MHVRVCVCVCVCARVCKGERERERERERGSVREKENKGKREQARVCLQTYIQPVPEKMTLEMVNEMQTKILNVGEILVN